MTYYHCSLQFLYVTHDNSFSRQVAIPNFSEIILYLYFVRCSTSPFIARRCCKARYAPSVRLFVCHKRLSCDNGGRVSWHLTSWQNYDWHYIHNRLFNDEYAIFEQYLELVYRLKVKVKVWTLAIAPLTWVRLVTSSALQSRKWQLIGMSQWCRTTLCGHPLPALTDNWTHSAANRHTIAPISHNRPSPRSRSYYSFEVISRPAEGRRLSFLPNHVITDMSFTMWLLMTLSDL